MLGVLMPIKDRVRQLRKAAGLTQQALAVKAGLSVSAVVQLEAGRVPDPRVSSLKALARALGVTLDALAGDEDEPEAAGPERPGGRPARGGRKRRGE
jgi:transcriptional regulator with XRE-family HTH domain